MSDQKILADEFRERSATQDVGLAVRYLDASLQIGYVQAERHVAEVMLNAEAGETVLDVGCGVGDVLQAIAQRVFAHGQGSRGGH